MELKHLKLEEHYAEIWLLIVPYGIETVDCDVKIPVVVLLIVPYGIETLHWP